MTDSNLMVTIIGNVAAAIIITMLAWGISYLRNKTLEKKLKASVSPDGVEMGFSPQYQKNGEEIPATGSFRIRIKNLVNVQIRVRKIILNLAGQTGRYELTFNKEIGVQQNPLSEILVRDGKYRTHYYKGFNDSSTDEFIVLPPLTVGTWELKELNINDKRKYFDQIFIVFEYPTLFGSNALVTIKADDKFSNQAQESLIEVMRAIKNPSRGLKLPRSFRLKLEKAGYDPDDILS